MVETVDYKCNYQVMPKTKTRPVRIGVRHIQTACMCACMTVLLVVRSSMGVAILAMTDINNKKTSVYNWSKETQGIILSSFFWGYTLMQIPGGILAKRFGGKTILFFALLANGVLCAIVPLLADWGGWIAVCGVRFAMGLTQACLFPSTHTLLGKWLPADERTSLASVVFAGVQLGTVIAMPLSGVLADTSLGWKMIFYSMSGLSIGMAVIWWALTSSTPDEHRFIREKEKLFIREALNENKVNQREMATPWKRILTSIPMLGIVFAHAGCFYTFLLFFNDMPSYLEKALHIKLKESALLSALPFAAQWAVTIFAGVTCEFIYNKKILSVTHSRKLFNTLGATGSTAGLIVLSFMGPENKVAAIATLCASVGLLAFQLSGFLMNHLDLSPQFAGIMLGLTSCVATAFAALSPIINGIILGEDSSDVSRWRIIFLLTGCISTVFNIAYVLLGTSERQPWDSSETQTPSDKEGDNKASLRLEENLLPKK